jgi:hypothetical protein
MAEISTYAASCLDLETYPHLQKKCTLAMFWNNLESTHDFYDKLIKLCALIQFLSGSDRTIDPLF